MLNEDLRTKLVETIRDLATPIDFERLIADGVLKKRGRGWYEILDVKKLPPHALKQVRALEKSSTGTLKFKFGSTKQAKALYDRIADK